VVGETNYLSPEEVCMVLSFDHDWT